MTLPEHWTEQDWFTFVLLDAAHADGKVLQSEIRSMGVGMGSERLVEAENLYLEISQEQRDSLIKLGIQAFLVTDDSRERLLKKLKNLFLADGEYAQEEQAWMKKISGWIRELSA